ncbi:MAG: tRNA (adenosine(37)-N6)-threonylcarbamoyltransferase complex transferase subunit TsaD [Planctomycetes bacterium]|nr:tRNA (adenosine(37)-N6)-threonylcarbamoyltransferase complex transferase subunit TsaD [Planctomycetota bacterium]
MLVLGVETSCDETAVALVRDGKEILSSRVLSQVEAHARFGGVVPNLAAREHVRTLASVLSSALEAAGGVVPDAVAVTDSPGLQAALLSGIAGAEGIALAYGIPLVGVNHVEAHLGAPFLALGELPSYPFLAFVVSGGHTHLFHARGPADLKLLGATIDDAAGEAFDKVAKMLGLGFPGGPALQRAAASGNPAAFRFKRPLLGSTSLDFSFSGLKTAVLYSCFGQEQDGRPRRVLPSNVLPQDVAASFQAAVVDVLVEKVRRAVAQTGVRRVAVGGGVACNGPLRTALAASAAALGHELLIAPPALCADNAAMVAARGCEHLLAGISRPPRVAPRTTWPREEVSLTP